MLFTIVVPVYNEEDHIFPLYEKLRGTAFPCEVEVIFVDDCSTDRSWSLLESLKETYPEVQIHRQAINQGKGAAIHAGIRLAKGEIFGIQDADLEIDPADLARLIIPIINQEAEVVYGSRFKSADQSVHRTFHYLVNRFLTLLSNLFSGIYLSDMETCYKVFKTSVIRTFDLKSMRFGFEPEITAKISKLHLRIQEYPISYSPRLYSQGKKIGWKDGFAAIWHIISFNLKRLTAEEIARSEPQYRPSRQTKGMMRFLFKPQSTLSKSPYNSKSP